MADIGRCDDCGTEDGERLPVMVDVTVAGVAERTEAWLCDSCREWRDYKRRNPGDPRRITPRHVDELRPHG